MTLVSFVNQILAILTVLGQIAIVGLLFYILTERKTILAWFGKNAILFSFIVALIATLGSLFYSEIAGYEPCKLCWFQRILMYPQAIILGTALLKRDKSVFNYSIILSAIGAAIAGYHYLLQIGVAPELPCSAVGFSAACSQRFVMKFGYITIPMMALTAFLLIAIMAVAGKIYKHHKLTL
jgi:disulfide bond formation protein DsbB